MQIELMNKQLPFLVVAELMNKTRLNIFFRMPTGLQSKLYDRAEKK
jgi:hypothetical protein